MRRLAMVILVALTALMLVGFTQSVTTPAAALSGEPAPPTETSPLFNNLYIFVLAGFVGLEVIGRVSPTLHTPLMSATNAISGISLVGSIIAAGAQYTPISTVLGTIAVAAATTNVVGGFMITDRMLKLFKRKPAGRGH